MVPLNADDTVDDRTDDRVSRSVMGSERFDRISNTEAICDLIIGEMVRNFFDSVENCLITKSANSNFCIRELEEPTSCQRITL